MDRTFAIERIESDLGRLPEVMAACVAIVNFLSNDTDAIIERVTFGQLSRVAGVNEVDEILPAVQYLSGARLHLLDPKFEVVNLAGNATEEITLDEVREYWESKDPVYHPESGEKIESIENSIFMFFVPSFEARELGRSSQ